MGIRENIEAVRDRISKAAELCGRDPANIQLVCVSKIQPAEAVLEAISVGESVFGENYIQEASEKIGEIGKDVSWHLIGHLQSNKARKAVELFDVIHSIDSIKLLRKIDNAAGEIGKRQKVMIQVDLAGEKTKFGLPEADLDGLMSSAEDLDNVEIIGLMCLPPFYDSPEEVRPFFAKMGSILNEMNSRYGLDMKELSMGMSGDMEAAIAEGSTMVRVGTDIFGKRQ